LSWGDDWPTIRFLVFRSESRCGSQRPQSQQDLSECKNFVDTAKKILHNLASLLLKQQRKTAGPAGTVLKVERRDL
jgi:hypothetical protein